MTQLIKNKPYLVCIQKLYHHDMIAEIEHLRSYEVITDPRDYDYVIIQLTDEQITLFKIKYGFEAEEQDDRYVICWGIGNYSIVEVLKNIA